MIRLCVGIEDPRDLLDDLETALVVAGAIVPAVESDLLTADKLSSLFNTDPKAWSLERARAFKRPNGNDSLVDGVTKGLANQTISDDIVVSAPGKVILFGEHAVVHGVVRDGSSA